MADDEKEGRGGGEDSTFEALERDFQEVRCIVHCKKVAANPAYSLC